VFREWLCIFSTGFLAFFLAKFYGPSKTMAQVSMENGRLHRTEFGFHERGGRNERFG
jgi:hypothetical protein